jgi:hypothetical protein
MRLIASLAIAAIAVSFSSTASAGLFHKAACCDAAPTCCEPAPAPSCGCEVAAPSCGCEVDPCCKPARKQLLKGLIAKLHARKASCCETASTCCEPAPAPTCCEPAPAPAPCAAPAPAPSCGCEVAAPSCGCEAEPCCKPARKHVLKNFFGKICARKSACCEPAPSCGCEVAAPSCGCN